MRLTYHLGRTTLDECGPTGGTCTEATPVDGIGDSAVLLRMLADDQTLVCLRVQRGDDVYEFDATDAPDTPDRLCTLAKAVLDQAIANGF
jgi:hypothetical protein